MTARTLALLFATAAFPLTAQAQETGAMPAETPPIAVQPGYSGDAPRGAADGMAGSGPFVTVPATGAWRTADLVGTDVYGAEGESIGEINDVLVNEEGQVAAVIIGVGGFLGIGEKDVAVSMSALRFGPGDGVVAGDPGYGTSRGLADPAAEEATGAVGARDPLVNGGATMAPGRDQVGTTVDPQGLAMDAEREAPELGDDGLPDRIVLSVTREQLEDAPAFEGVSAANDWQ